MSRPDSEAILEASVLVVGNVNFDLVFPAGRLPVSHEKLRLNEGARGVGGVGANTASHLAAFGHRSAVLSAVGDDALGAFCVADLRSRGVDTSLLRRVSGAATGIAAIFSGATDKRMVTVAGPSRAEAMRTLPDDRLRAWSHLHVAGCPDDALVDLVLRARLRGLTVSVEWNGEAMDRVAQCADLQFMNADELARLERFADNPRDQPDVAAELAHALARSLDSNVVISLGAQGAVWCSSKGGRTMESTVPLVPVDRTGGGDAFDAGVISGFVQGKPHRECLRQGLALASEVLMVAGAMPNVHPAMRRGPIC